MIRAHSTPANSRRLRWTPIALLAPLVVAGCATAPATPATPPPPSEAAVSAPVDPCAAGTCATVPGLVGLTAPAARSVLEGAGFTVPNGLANQSDRSTVTQQYPVPGTRMPTSTAFVLDYWTPPAPPQPARAISARDWALIAKDPDSHTGERVVVYGKVTQFDSATGTSSFRANVDGVVHKPRYGYVDYETNTFLTGTEDLLTDLVADDLFRAEVTVSGSLSYQTTMGGNMTVPRLEVTAITTTGQSK